MRRIGILTGGGDCPGLNAVLRAVVKCVAEEGGAEVVGIRNGFLGLLEGRFEALSGERVSGILPRGGTILGSSNRDNPFRWSGRLDGRELRDQDRSGTVLRHLDEAGIDVLIAVGGDGTLAIGEQFQQLGRQVIGVPKTIDNDLAATDQCFGFDTAVSICTEAVDRIHSTAESHDRVMLVEVMGRHAGFIALQAGLAGGGDVILLPEIPFQVASVVRAIEDRRARGRDFSIVVVAEGAKAEGGAEHYDRVVAGSFEPRRLGGISRWVAEAIEGATGIETRTTILGHVQRGGTPSAVDRVLGTRFGVAAARLALAGSGGRMVALRGSEIVDVPLRDGIERPRRVDVGGGIVAAARATGVRFGDEG